MAVKLGTIWDLEPHTAAKHAILRRYLEAWIPILSSAHSRIVYVDAFAGPGVYSGGEDGSPTIALKAALAHESRIHGEMVFLFVEKDIDRAKNLESCITSLSLPGKFKTQLHVGNCAETISALLDDLDASGGKLAPTFAFLDPFGFSHTPLTLVARLMAQSRCEVLITFMYEEINRFLSHIDQPRNFDELFGTNDWQKTRAIQEPSERRRALRDLYKRQLETVANIKFVRAFEMKNKHNQTDYFLYFGTNSLEGLKKMKEAMWRVDQTGTFEFADATDATQTILFANQPNYDWLKSEIRRHFQGATFSVEELEAFVLTSTPYRETHFKKEILAKMEQAGELVVESSERKRKWAFPAGTTIRLISS